MNKTLLSLLFLFLSLGALAQKSTDDALALQYFREGEFEKAASIYEKLFNRGSNQQFYYEQYLSTLLKLKKYADAEKAVKKMMKAFPESFSYQIDFGRLLREQGNVQKANEWYDNLVKNLPKEEFAIRELSIAFYRAEAYDYAAKALLNGRKVLHNEGAFAYDLISLYRYQKNKPMLIQEYLEILGAPETEQNIVNQAKNTFSTVFDSPDDYNQLRIAILRKLQKAPQNIPYADLLAWLYIQQKQYDMALKQIIALDKRLKEEGDRVFNLSVMLIANKSYETAIEGLQYLINKGKENSFYIPATIQLLNAKNHLVTDGKASPAELLQLEKDYQNMLTEFGKSATTVYVTLQLANLQAFQLNKPKAAEALLEDALKTPKLPLSSLAQIKLALGDVYILTGELWEAALIYGQVEKEFANEPNGQEAKFRGAKLSYYQGEFAWAKAQLDVLKSSTSQLIANDALNLSLQIQENTETLADTNSLKKYAQAELLIFKNQSDKALMVLDSIHTLYPGNSLEDDILMAKARIYLKQDKIQQAVQQLQSIVDNHSFELWADDALFTLGDIYETKLNDREKAKSYFQKIITDYPGSFFAAEARIRFRNLRGDNIG